MTKNKEFSDNCNVKGNIKRETLNFFEQVWEVAKLIPKGRVTSYGAIAKYL